MWMRNNEPAPVTLAGKPAAATVSAICRRTRSPSAFSRATASRSKSCMAVRPAVITSGLAEKVPECGTRTLAARGSSTSMMSARPARRHRQPPADDLAERRQVGREVEPGLGALVLAAVGDDFVEDQQRPVRAVQSCIAWTKAFAAGMKPTRCGIGSMRTQANSPACSSKMADAVSGSLKGITTTSSSTPCGVPYATGLLWRMSRLAPVGRVGGLADLGVVVEAVIGALGLGDLRPGR